MCFGCDDDESDIWLSIENGTYVPAPPMIYMPGLRQIHDRIHHQAGSKKSSYLPSSHDVVRLPVTLNEPPSVPLSLIPAPQPQSTESTPSTSTQPTPEQLTPESTTPTVTDDLDQVSASTADNTLPESPEVRSGSSPRQKRPEASVQTSYENQGQEQPHSPLPVDAGAPASVNSAASSSSNDTPLSPSNSSSSLHSILKKPSNSTSEGIESETSNQLGKGKHKNEKRAPRLKVKKSVSFAEDTTVPTPELPHETQKSCLMTAAEEGAIIARKLAEKKSASHGRGKVSEDSGGGDGSADLRRNSRVSRHEHGLMSSAPGMKKILRQTMAPNGGTGALRGECEGRKGADRQQAGRVGLARSLFPGKHDESCIDDEIPRRWP
ncbi:hypothetical protein EPUS_03217 [Endocarpon pusillum Z07020]|uniref:Uncharacterized protein n=1 Tax=Endocarpon pusillum (strain Z07020 / HMAS-L-300199) TaxID=1263415 RepID=U1GR47_ENDPU|nr:uncharacterized protein EPUS_03217 [Endocarpon pusillum Z07020]ERF74833.1 hypothetical protein EPUS_03217 [Endocarpon pusillum Z07020]